jgi:hypothetical protein
MGEATQPELEQVNYDDEDCESCVI